MSGVARGERAGRFRHGVHRLAGPPKASERALPRDRLGPKRAYFNESVLDLNPHSLVCLFIGGGWSGAQLQLPEISTAIYCPYNTAIPAGWSPSLRSDSPWGLDKPRSGAAQGKWLLAVPPGGPPGAPLTAFLCAAGPTLHAQKSVGRPARPCPEVSERPLPGRGRPCRRAPGREVRKKWQPAAPPGGPSEDTGCRRQQGESKETGRLRRRFPPLSGEDDTGDLRARQAGRRGAPAGRVVPRGRSALSIRPTNERRSWPQTEQERHRRPRGSAPERRPGKQGRPRKKKGRPGPGQRGPSAAGPVADLRVDRRRGSGRPAPRERREGRGGKPSFLAAAEAPGGP